MTIKRLPPKIITEVIHDTISATAEKHADLDLPDVISLAVTARLAYPATCSGVAGPTVYLLTSPTSAHFDNENTTDAFAFFNPLFVKGETHQKTINVDALPRYLRVLVRNPASTSCTCSALVHVTKVYNEVT